MNTEKRIAELEEKEIAARRERLELEEAKRDAVSRPILRKLIGKCFKFYNGYNSTEKWWLYCKIISLDEKNMTFKAVNFQHTTRRRVEVEYESVYNYNGKSRIGVDNGWHPISLSEYNKERRRALRFLRELLG